MATDMGNIQTFFTVFITFGLFCSCTGCKHELSSSQYYTTDFTGKIKTSGTFGNYGAKNSRRTASKFAFAQQVSLPFVVAH